MSADQPDNMLTWSNGDETVLLYACGKNAIRVLIRRQGHFSNHLSALEAPIPRIAEPDASGGAMINGHLRAEIDSNGKLSFFNHVTGDLLVQEAGMSGTPIKRQSARFYRPTSASAQNVRVEYIAADERIWGMGQQRHAFTDHKGSIIDLQCTNGEYTVPFYVSSRGYGFLWNNPATGKVTFARNRTLWELDECEQIDYWVIAGDDYPSIVTGYVQATGLPPVVPQRMLGYWQCKLRYKTQAEVLEVARTFNARQIPIDILVIDFFHWPEFGDFRFNADDWPDPQAMVDELREMGIELVVSVWPTVSTDSANIERVEAERLMIRNRNGLDIQRFLIKHVADEHAEAGSRRVRDYVYFLDFFNPATRKFAWEQVKEHYCRYGIRHFWLDANEPALNRFDFEQLAYHGGSGAAQGNLYPNEEVKGFRAGLDAEGEHEAMLLCRGAWAGIQKYGAATWSGDIISSFDELRMQITMSLHAAVSGLHLWHTDIGGFKLGPMERTSEEFTELLIRWFEWGVFSPVCRMHGNRSPNEPVQPDDLCDISTS